jgi:GNAT superfamily N-acetyltransferase
MLDRSRTHGRGPGHLRPGTHDASASHYWLMRRDLQQPIPAVNWPANMRLVAFTTDNAADVHNLFMLGTELGGGHVAEFNTWLQGFQTDPEFDPALCLVVEDPLGVVAVAQCWTSAFIRNLVVHPRAQRQGLGLALLNQVFETFAERHEGRVDLKVMESNLAARQLYERAGMHYVQRRELDPR